MRFVYRVPLYEIKYCWPYYYNMHKITVSELNDSIVSTINAHHKKTVIVVGEVSNPKVSGNNTYLTLKDSCTSINVNFFGMKLGSEVDHGSNVEVTGVLNYYAPRGTLGLNGKKIEKVGAGSIHARYEQIREEFQKKGYFNNKKAIPSKISNIGVVTAAQGAALQDFIRVLRNNNFDGAIYIYDATVQGPRCPDSVVAGIKFFDSPFYDAVDADDAKDNDADTEDSDADTEDAKDTDDSEDTDAISVSDADSFDPFNDNKVDKPNKPRKTDNTDNTYNTDKLENADKSDQPDNSKPKEFAQIEVDVVVVMRGGGSFEDLMGFSDPKVLEALYRSKRYTISSVGHEVDSMLCDFVSNCSVGTPSMAGDVISKAYASSFNKLHDVEKQLMMIKQSILSKLYNTRQEIQKLESGLTDPVAEVMQRISDIQREAESRIKLHLAEYSKALRNIVSRIVYHDASSMLSNGFSVLVGLDGRIIKDADLFGRPLKLIHGTGEYTIVIQKN